MILDVREPYEFTALRVPGSVNVPLSQLLSDGPGILANCEGDVLILCKVGARAQVALNLIHEHDLAPHLLCTVYAGGITRWVSEGHPTEEGAELLDPC